MNKTTYIKSAFLVAMCFFIVLGLADHAEAKSKRKKDCGNFINQWGHHETGGNNCDKLGGQYCKGYQHPVPPAPTCPVANFCQGGDVWRTESSCSSHPYQVCLSGCTNGACNLPATTTRTSCVQNQPCVSAPNACGMTNGVKSCATNTCVAPSNSLCLNSSCIGPDGATIASGDSRTYYPSTTSCIDAQTRTCTNGVLSGAATYTSSTCVDNTGVAPEIKVFRMTPTDVNKNGMCTMVWEVNYAQNCTITGPGITSINAKLPSGTAKTAPITKSSLYSLTCTNTKGSVQKTAICRLNADVIED